jgi:hypothetical protein
MLNKFFIFNILTFFIFSSPSAAERELISDISLETLLEVNNDLKSTHQASPMGVPKGYDWYSKPKVGLGNNPGLKFNAFTGWGQLFWVKYHNNDVLPYVAISNFQAYMCVGDAHNWYLVQKGEITGRQFTADFKNNLNQKPISFETQNDTARVVFNVGTAFHFWPKSGQVKIPDKNICGILILAKARVESKDENSNLLLGLGADYWTIPNSHWDQFKTNKEAVIGRLKLITTQWKWYGVSTASDQDIEKLIREGFLN